MTRAGAALVAVPGEPGVGQAPGPRTG
ncbi:hypothetical protein GA0115242_113116, partial [Streptomyces sp. SolWspMP-5a-2]